MNTFYQPKFSKAILTALFTGFFATIICMIYNIVYRENTSFELSDIINVSSLIFFINLVFLIIGAIYYGFQTMAKKNGDIIFILVFILITIYFSWKATSAQRSDDPLLNLEFDHLLLAMVIIMGVFASFGIPFLYHNKKFEENVI